ncbi:hypothetical protein E1301_Tti018850 [Triplophysa tibetana]|uniref:Uncharacterized protein n=1 Tax=Triplophysa tibetana TaxID=1572043 RepID=A0A5A9NMF5_9TELE|nr:hypothetical protein E1301_Tti018850 [Triplophysa tibetana]
MNSEERAENSHSTEMEDPVCALDFRMSVVKNKIAQRRTNCADIEIGIKQYSAIDSRGRGRSGLSGAVFQHVDRFQAARLNYHDLYKAFKGSSALRNLSLFLSFHFSFFLSLAAKYSGGMSKPPSHLLSLETENIDNKDSFNIQRDQPLPPAGASTGVIIGGIIAAIIILCLIGAGVAMYKKRQQSIENGEGPPKHKPPPPINSGSSTEMLNKPQDNTTTITETQPLRKYEPNYYETTSAEPVTDLDDDNTGPPANGGAPTVWDSSGHLPEKEDSADEPLPPYAPINQNDMEGNHRSTGVNIAREESFVSPAMLV